LRILCTLALNYLLALAVWWAMPRIASARIRVALAIALGTICTFLTLIVPREYPLIRAGLSVFGALTGSRICSYGIEGEFASLREYLRFISFAMLRPYLVFTRKVQYTRPQVGREVIRLLVCAAIIPPAFFISQSFVLSPLCERSWIAN